MEGSGWRPRTRTQHFDFASLEPRQHLGVVAVRQRRLVVTAEHLYFCSFPAFLPILGVAAAVLRTAVVGDQVRFAV